MGQAIVAEPQGPAAPSTCYSRSAAKRDQLRVRIHCHAKIEFTVKPPRRSGMKDECDNIRPHGRVNQRPSADAALCADGNALTCGEVVALPDRLYVGCIKNGFAGAGCIIDHNVVQMAFSRGLAEVLPDAARKCPSPYLSAAEHLDVPGPLLLQRPPLMKRSCRVIADRGR